MPMSTLLDLPEEPQVPIQHKLLAVTDEQPANSLAWLLLGWTSPTAEQAEQYFKQALLIRPGDALAQDGLECVQRGKWQAVEIQQINWHSLVQAGEVAGIAGKRAEATASPYSLEAALGNTNPTGSGEAFLEESATGGQAQAAPYELEWKPTSREEVHAAQRATWLMAGFYLAGITLAEWLTTLFAPAAGLMVHGVLLVALFIHSALAKQRHRQRMLATLALAPLIRLVSLSLPLTDFDFYLWYAIVGAPLLMAAFMVLRYSGFRWSEIGMRMTALPLQLAVGLSGLGLGYLEYLILRPQPLTESFSLQQIWFPAVISRVSQVLR